MALRLICLFVCFFFVYDKKTRPSRFFSNKKLKDTQFDQPLKFKISIFIVTDINQK